MGVFQLIYISRAARTERAWVLEAIDSIKRFACDRNPTRGVTGVLLYGNGHFMQLLEGPEEGVRQTFERISRDPRHTDVRVLCERAFPTRLHARPSLGVLNLETDAGDPAGSAREMLAPREGESEREWRSRLVGAFELLAAPIGAQRAA